MSQREHEPGSGEGVWCEIPGCPSQPNDWKERLGLLYWGGRGFWAYLDSRQEGQLERLSRSDARFDQLMREVPPRLRRPV